MHALHKQFTASTYQYTVSLLRFYNFIIEHKPVKLFLPLFFTQTIFIGLHSFLKFNRPAFKILRQREDTHKGYVGTGFIRKSQKTVYAVIFIKSYLNLS